ncbi:MAG: 16S rRNA (guanine(966)-N(2))-methyltransferase RsmD [Deltaproteobacteria bacterium]|nr:16S rRNA (guanine(966)-N(2))-methyltransferase RsmD [Deltaproteobacteria bacterium]
MLISSGWAKGARLQVPPGDATRPTAVKVRAAALNMLAHDLPGAQVLDLFAGSGAMGLEAVSRGAARAVFVEHAAPALKALKANIAEVERRARVQGLDQPPLSVLARSLPESLTALRGPFDVVFIDPPYNLVSKLAVPLLAGIAGLVAEGGIVLCESAAADAEAIVAAAASGWQVHQQRAYGETALVMLLR